MAFKDTHVAEATLYSLDMQVVAFIDSQNAYTYVYHLHRDERRG